MTTPIVQDNFRELLREVGAIPPRRGHGKWTCPACGRQALSVDEQKQLFNCFQAACDFHGGRGALRSRLGLGREWLPREEFLQRQRDRTRASRMAAKLYAAWKEQWSGQIDILRALYDLEDSAHRLGPDNPMAWDALGIVYESRPQAQTELLILEVSPIPKLVKFLSLDPRGRKAVIERVVFNCGIYDGEGRFVELRI